MKGAELAPFSFASAQDIAGAGHHKLSQPAVILP
jgi:hypothetical protein